MGQVWIIFKDLAFSCARGEPPKYVPDRDACPAYDRLAGPNTRAHHNARRCEVSRHHFDFSAGSRCLRQRRRSLVRGELLRHVPPALARVQRGQVMPATIADCHRAMLPPYLWQRALLHLTELLDGGFLALFPKNSVEVFVVRPELRVGLWVQILHVLLLGSVKPLSRGPERLVGARHFPSFRIHSEARSVGLVVDPTFDHDFPFWEPGSRRKPPMSPRDLLSGRHRGFCRRWA